MSQILINHESLETRVAIATDGVIQEYFIERNDEDNLVGSVIKGVICNLEPALQAAFVDIGADKNAFLHYWDMLPASMDALEGGSALGDDVDVPDEEEITAITTPEPVGFIARLKAFFGGGEDIAEVVDNPPKDTHQRNRRRKKGKAPKSQSDVEKRTTPLTIEEIPDLFPEKSEVHVQVTKGPIGSKGARVTANLSVPGRFLVLLPNSRHIGISKKISDRKERDRLRKIVRGLRVPKGMGLIVRTVAEGQSEDMFQRDYRMVLSAWKEAQTISREKKGPVCVYEEPRLVRRTLRDYLNEEVTEIIADTEESCEEARKMIVAMGMEKAVRIRFYKGPVPIFHKFGLSRQIENIFHRKVPLPSGGYICIDETEALIAIDVNTGRSRGGKDHPETILNTNLEAVDEIARQLRIRNLGGLLVLDLIDMRSKEDRQTVQKALRDAFRKDRARTRISPISTLGLVEMTRQREHESLRDTVYSSCPYCKGRGLVKSSKSVSVELQRRLQSILRQGNKKRDLRVNVHPQVLDRLRKEDSELLKSLEHDFGGQLSFRGDEDLHHEEFVIIDQANGREMR
ncbi:MAG: Rne/Rng family ribonuclease [Lentisphaeria bacterium]|nr:Rne/Rng family ribonuclease [Lentisphaeria bacterium]